MQRLHELECIGTVGHDTTFAIDSADFSPHIPRGEREIGGKADADRATEVAGAIVTVSAHGLAVKAAEPIELIDVALGDVTEV
jgi:hypothetical protein